MGMRLVEWYPGALEQAGIPSGTKEVDMDRNEIYDLSHNVDVMISKGTLWLDVKDGMFRVR
jgi:hypothetical protein